MPFFVIALIVPILLSKTPPEAIDVANIADSNFVQINKTQKVVDHIDITRAYGGVGRRKYFLTELNVVCTYVRLLFLPINQNFDYDYPISHGIDNKTALCGVFLLCLLVLAAVTYKSYRIISFSILWFFIVLSVESSFIPIGDVITEYRPYLASVGFVFLVMNLIYMRQVDVKKLNFIAAVILMGFSILTYQRNKVWKDEVTLWNDTVQKSPYKARPYYNRGLAYYHQGNLAQALSDYNKAIEINPNYADAYYERGISYGQKGNLYQAISDYTKTIEINPNYAWVYFNRGNAYVKQGNFIQAFSDLNKAIEITPNFVNAYFLRGFVYANQGNFIQAISDYTKAIEINPNYAEVYNDRGTVYDDLKNFSQAITDFNKAIDIDPNFAGAYNNRGFTYGEQGNITQALLDFTKCIELNPNFAGAYFNRGFAYYYQKEYDKAWSDMYKAEGLGVTVNPDFIRVLEKASGKDKKKGNLK